MMMTPQLALPAHPWQRQETRPWAGRHSFLTAERPKLERMECAKFGFYNSSEARKPSSAFSSVGHQDDDSPMSGFHANRQLKGRAYPAMRSQTESLTRQQLDDALSGDSSALLLVIERLTPVIQARLTRLLLRNTSSHPTGDDRRELEDLVQEVFLNLFADGAKVLRSWDPDKGASLLNFVGLITERYAISILRSRHRWLPTESLDPERADPMSDEADPEGRATSRQTLRHLLHRLQTALSPQGWAVFRLLFVEERSISDIGNDVGLSTDAIYAWRSRLRKTARGLKLDMEHSGEASQAIPRSPL